MLEYIRSFHSIFTGHRAGIDRAREYVSGLLVADKGHMLRTEEAVRGADEQALQHFLSSTTWDESVVMEQVARDVDPLPPLSPAAAARRRRWREPIRRIYETGPLHCPRRGSLMRVVAFITARSLLRAILDPLARRVPEGRAPPA